VGAFDHLKNSVENMISGRGRDLSVSGEVALQGAPMAIFYVEGGPLVVKSQPREQVLLKVDLPSGRNRKKAAVELLIENGYEPAGPLMRMGSPSYYAVPVSRPARRK